MSIHHFPRLATRFAGLVLALLLLPLTAHAAAGVCRVTAEADGTGTGQDPGWADPMTLQQALVPGACAQVWVKAGVYTPGAANETAKSFVIGPDIAIYGGFAGSETAREQRDPAVNVTILSGDLEGDDTDVNNNGIDESAGFIVGANSEHVVYMTADDGTAITASTRLDGLTITAGRCQGNQAGGGLVCVASGAGSECSPTISNVTFSGNSASLRGGAVYVAATDGAVSNSTFSNVTFSGNTANPGGAFYLGTNGTGTNSATFYNTTFNDNHAGSNSGGAIRVAYAGATFYNVTFAANSADLAGGGAIYAADSAIELHDAILWGNTANVSPQISNEQSTITIDHSVIEGAFPGGTWDADLGTDVGGNTQDDPQLGALGQHGGSTATILLGAGSSAIDAGSGRCLPDGDNVLAIDQRGLSRPQGPSCDIGAVEMPYAVTLTVGSVSGFGSVSAAASPAALSGAIAGCGNAGSCSADYAQNTLVQLVATPATGSLFTGWSGDCSGAGLQFNVLMDTAKSCNASFTIDPNAALVVAMDDGQQYAHVGDWLTYSITISNYSGAAVNEVAVTNVLPAQLHSARWQCMPSQGATCIAHGSGQLADTVNLPAYSSVFYVLTAQVQAGVSDTVVNLVGAARDSGTTTATDTTTLVIFRNGFDGDDAMQGMTAAPMILALDKVVATGGVILPIRRAQPQRRVATLAASANGSLRVESVRVGAALWLRLVTRVSGTEHHSQWSPLTDAAARIHVTTDADGVRRVRLLGTRTGLDLPAPASTTHRAAH